MGEPDPDLDRARDGDREAFGRLVRRHQRRVYAAALHILGNHSDADDATVIQHALQSLAQIITNGVPNPKEYRAPMPPLSGGQLSPAEISAVAAYVWTLSHRSAH